MVAAGGIMANAVVQLVGRPAELDGFERILGEVERGDSAAVALVGEPGIGKTRLLGELARRADRRGQLVLMGSAAELERELPFHVFVDALDDYVRGLPPSTLAAVSDDGQSELGHVLPSFARDAEQPVL